MKRRNVEVYAERRLAVNDGRFAVRAAIEGVGLLSAAARARVSGPRRGALSPSSTKGAPPLDGMLLLRVEGGSGRAEGAGGVFPRGWPAPGSRMNRSVCAKCEAAIQFSPAEREWNQPALRLWAETAPRRKARLPAQFAFTGRDLQQPALRRERQFRAKCGDSQRK